MKMSIRTRLFATVSLLVVFFVAFSWLMNSTYLERYYIYQNKKQLISVAENIDASYRGNIEDLAAEIDKLERNSGLDLLILDSNLNLKYYSLGIDETNASERVKRLARRPDSLLPLVVKYLPSLQAGSKVIAVSQEQNEQVGLINVVSKLNNGDYLLLSVPLVSIQDSAAVANRFFLFTGLLTVLIGLLAAYFFARNFTKPILDLNQIAQKMSRLDFSSRYESPAEDELGELGSSINSLSAQLDKSIADLQAANLKLQEDIEKERRIDQMRRQFVSNVSHELKTPIALIQGYAEGLKLNVTEDEASKNYYCDVIADEADKMNKMVKELLELSQIEAGYIPLQKSEFNLSLMLQEVLKKYQFMLQDEKIGLELKVPGELWVEGDQNRIEQVLGNYLNNAIDHVAEQGQIIVEAGIANDKVRVSVFNTGTPIPDDALDKLFTSFYKVDEARNRSFGGAGLGLSIVRAIMELHHNNYGAANVPGGVLFWFELDLKTK